MGKIGYVDDFYDPSTVLVQQILVSKKEADESAQTVRFYDVESKATDDFAPTT